MEPAKRCIASHAADSDYAPLARALLAKLGYAVLPAEEAPDPELRVVREDRLDELPDAAGPIIVLANGRRRPRRHPNHAVAGVVRRPAGLHELYRLFQSVLEDTPRAVLRVPVSLAARGRSGDREWKLTVSSLSENGCLAEGPERLPFETRLRLEIELPWGERLVTPAVATYEQGPCLGLVFHGITLTGRRRMAKAVVSLLARS